MLIADQEIHKIKTANEEEVEELKTAVEEERFRREEAEIALRELEARVQMLLSHNNELEERLRCKDEEVSKLYGENLQIMHENKVLLCLKTS